MSTLHALETYARSEKAALSQLEADISKPIRLPTPDAVAELVPLMVLIDSSRRGQRGRKLKTAGDFSSAVFSVVVVAGARFLMLTT